MELKIKDVSKLYGNQKVALNHVSFTLTEGVYGLLGANGAGKSTLMNIITDNIKMDTGSITYNGTDILKLGEAYREILGYMPQQQGLYDDFTGRRFLWYMAALKGIKKKQAKEKIDEMFTLVNLQEDADKRLGSYSGGMKQRILIAQALLNEPKILILDEPTAGLDPKERIRIRNFISQLSVDKIVILATHVVSDIEFVAKEIILLKRGKLLAKEEPVELLQKMQGKVFEVYANIEDLEQLQENYRVSNISNRVDGICVRIVGDKRPEQYQYEEVKANLEDVYMYYFEEEREKK